MLWEDNYLAHYDIKGQKWGIRRFQNEDGTLTEAGKARVAKAGLYREPSFKGPDKNHRENRDKVSNEYNETWWSRHDEMYDGPHAPSQTNKELFDRFKDKYAAATLKDLGLRNVKKALRDVKGILKEIDPNYEFGKEYTNSELEDFKKRRKKIEHPKREKVKRAASKVKDVADTVLSVKKLIPGA